MSIEQPLQPEEENLNQVISRLVSAAPASIEAEFGRAANPWISCFCGHLDAIDTYVGLYGKAQLSAEEYSRLDEKIEQLKQKADGLRKRYGKEEESFSEELKQELLDELSALL